MDSMRATELFPVCWQRVSLTLRIGLTSTLVVLLSYNPELLSGLSVSSKQHPRQESQCLAVWLSRQTDRWVDRWIRCYLSVFLCFVPPVQQQSSLLKLINFLFLCSTEAKLLWCVGVSLRHCERKLTKQTVLLGCIVHFKLFRFSLLLESEKKKIHPNKALQRRKTYTWISSKEKKWILRQCKCYILILWYLILWY